jgi:hypothetical protein
MRSPSPRLPTPPFRLLTPEEAEERALSRGTWAELWLRDASAAPPQPVVPWPDRAAAKPGHDPEDPDDPPAADASAA